MVHVLLVFLSHQALARSPRPEWLCTFYLLKYSGNRLTSFVHYLLLFHLPSRGIACKLMNILKVAYFQCNETIDACHSTFAMMLHKTHLFELLQINYSEEMIAWGIKELIFFSWFDSWECSWSQVLCYLWVRSKAWIGNYKDHFKV